MNEPLMNNVETLGTGRFLELVSKNGWEYIRRTNCRGIAVIVALTQHDEILLVQQYRPPIGQNSLELPAGLIDDGEGENGESALEAAKRELLEETGYIAEHWHMGLSGPGGAGASSDILNFFIATGARKVAGGGGDSTEKIVVHAVARDGINGWLAEKQRQGLPVDPKIYAGLYLLSTYNNGAN